MDAPRSGPVQQLEPTFACSPPPGTARVEVVLAATSGVVPERVLRRLPQGYRLLPVPLDGRARGGLAAAWAVGLSRATAAVVVLLDGRCGVDPRELERVAEPVARGSADLVLGSRRADLDLASLLAWPPHRRLADALATRRLARRLDLTRAGTEVGPDAPDLPPLRPSDAARVLAGRRQLLAAVSEPGPEGLLVTAVSRGWRTAQVPVRCAPWPLSW